MGATAAEKRRMAEAEAEEKRRKRNAFTTIHPPNTYTLMCVISAIDFFEPESASSATL